MIINILLLILGMVLLIKGADFFVDGASKIAKALKIPSLIIGLTLVSMGTSAPEAAVSLSAAFKNMDASSIANIVGSNIFNTLFILGASAIFVPLIINKDMKKYDIPIMVGTYVLLILFSFVITPYVLQTWEAIILLTLFIGYIIFLILRAKKDKSNINSEDEDRSEFVGKKGRITIIKSIFFTIIGLAGIIFGGTLVVDNAEVIAKKLGMSETLIGLTILAVGTSLPELVTSVVASIKKENEIAVGNIIGSNIFNILFILGLSATIFPLSVPTIQFVDMMVMLATGLFVFIVSLCTNKIARWQGIVWMLLYVAYITFIILRNYL